MSAYLIAIFGVILTAVLIGWLHRSQEHSRQEIADRSAPLPTLSQDNLSDRSLNPALEPRRFEAENAVDYSALQTTPAPDDNGQLTMADRAQEPLVNTQPDLLPAGQQIPDSAPSTRIRPKTPVRPSLAKVENWLEHIKALRESDDMESALALAVAHFPRTQALQQAAVILRQQLRYAIENRHPAEPLFAELYNVAVLADLYRSSNPDKPAQLPDFATWQTTARQRYQLIGYNKLKLLNKSDAKALEQLWGQPADHQHSEQLFQL